MVKTTDKKSPLMEPIPDSARENEAFLEVLTAISETQLPGETENASPAKGQSPEQAVLSAPAGLPRERAPDKPLEERSPEDHLPELLKFYLLGKRPAGKQFRVHLSAKLTPALLDRYRDFSKIRYIYPVCLHDSQTARRAVPLKEIFDELIANSAIAGEDEEAQRWKRNLSKLEFKIRSLLEKQGEGRFVDLWEEATAVLIKESNLKNQKQDLLKQQFAEARKLINLNGSLVEYSEQTPLQLLQFISSVLWGEKTAQFHRELRELIRKLNEILETDNARAGSTSGSVQISKAFGNPEAGDLDFEAFSNIVAESAVYTPLSKKRRKRIEGTVRTLQEMWKFYAPEAGEENGESAEALKNSAPFRENVTDYCEVALEMFYAQLQKMVEFFKSVRIARLEIENNYREEKHRRFFSEFSIEFLTPEELNLYPPVILSLSSDALTLIDKSDIVDILSSDLPIKILLHVDDLFEGENAAMQPYRLNSWSTHLARMALNLNNAYVFQCAAADVTTLVAGMREGLAHKGPALLAVYTAASGNYSHLPTYLIGAAAQECRVFPTFIYNPMSGEDWASRFHLEYSSQPEKLWPANEFTYQKADGQEATISLEFTFADFLATDNRFREHFMVVPPQYYHQNLLPLNDYLQLQDPKTSEKIPYLLMVKEDRLLCRVIPTQVVINATRRIATIWKNLQELGGVNNSFARKLLEQEQERLQTEARREIETLQQRHEAEMERAIGELTEEIVSRIAAGLLNERFFEQAAPAADRPQLPGKPAAPPSSEKSVAEAETAETVESETAGKEPAEAVEEEEISFDEPYIDTPLCTSCNDCINLNNRMFAYNENKQAYIKDPTAGTFRELVEAAEKCPVNIIHPGKPKNPDESGLEELITRAEKYN